MSSVMFWNVCMLLSPIVQIMNQYYRGKILENLMALSAGFWTDIYPLDRNIHLSHNEALYFTRLRYQFSLCFY